MELYVFNRNLDFQGIIEGYTSLTWTRKYFKIGEFELHCSLTPNNLTLLSKESIIYKKGDSEAGYIEYRNLSQDETGKEKLIVKGKFITGYLNRRIIWGTEIFNTTPELAMRRLVNDNAVNPLNPDRILNKLELGTLNNIAGNVDYQVSYQNLADEIENLSNVSNIGYRIRFDTTNKKLVFESYVGLDRSVNQSVNPRCIFSREFENILQQEYTDSINNYKNLVLIGGVGEGTLRKLVTVGTSTGLDRFEIFNDQKGLSNDIDGTIISDTDYTNLLIGKGNETLAENMDIQTFDNKLNLNSSSKYKEDFDLGDIVTCLSKRWNITLDSRIIEVEEVYEESGIQVTITFGNNIPTLIDKIKSMSKQQINGGGIIISGNTSTSIDGGTF